MRLQLERPLIFLDLETTGTDILKDRVVQIAVLKRLPDGSEESRTRLINPTIPIPKAATVVHGISDEDVAGQPRFNEIARSFYDFLTGSDIAGYNSNNFDVPFLVEEFARAGIEWPDPETRLIDVCTIFKRKEERTLSAAYMFYCNRTLEDAHNAEADVKATQEVFDHQLERYEDIGSLSVEGLHEFCNRDGIVDFARKLKRTPDGKVVFNFGQHRGKPVSEHPDYVSWMLESDFPQNTKTILRKLLASQST